MTPPQKPKKQPFETAQFDDEALHGRHDPALPVYQEKGEPFEGNSEMPFALFVAVVFLAFGMGVYLTRYSFDFDFFIYDHNKHLILDAGSIKEEVWDPLVQGEKIFKKNCTQCHQTTGLGVPGSYPPLAGSSWLLGIDAIPVRVLLKGLEGPIEVEKAQFNGAMPTFGTKFSDKQIAAVLSYVRQAWGNAAPAVQEGTVTQIRQALGDRSRVFSATELMSVK